MGTGVTGGVIRLETSILHSNNTPQSVTYVNDRFYVLDGDDGKVYGYGSDGQRDAAGDFDLVNSDPFSITYANDRFYVLDPSDAKGLCVHEFWSAC